MSPRPRFCDGIARRSFLQVGAVGAFGFGLNLPTLLAQQARAAETGGGGKDDVSVIYVFLKGGLSTIDTFDMKPDAPVDIRGDFKPAKTNVPGVQICELLPRVAQQMDKISLVRSFGHKNSSHGPADHYMLTGYHPTAGFNPGLKPNNQRPSLGSIVARKLGPRGSVPAYVCLPNLHPSAGAAYLGAAAAPFVIDADPSAVGFAVPDLAPPLVLDASRLQRRRRLLARVDRFQRAVETEANIVEANSNARTVNVFRQKAFELATSPRAKKAFDIHAESDKLRDQYGRHTLGQSCLMARRLVEAGVRCVTVNHSNWDTHDNNFVVLKKELLPMFDSGISTLFRDLHERGMLKTTLVVITGEFGRTPRINNRAGRDHWGPGFTVILGGGGLAGGCVVGSSDKWAEKPADNPYGPEDLAATVFHQLGINPKLVFHTPEGRPVPAVNDGRVIRGLM
ncbi:MAG: DUF1501 domain-containing protein [Planctomycetes bacterium]|nr:DUF1501 domain-containing protein [Planctomycetota bacterium]